MSGSSSPEQKELQMLNKVKEHLAQGKNIRDGDWSPAEVELLNTMQLLTAKRCIVLINLSEQDYIRKKNKWIPKIKTWLEEHAPSDSIIPVRWKEGEEGSGGGGGELQWSDRMKERGRRACVGCSWTDSLFLQISCVLEKKLVSMDEAERKTFFETNNVQSCLPKVMRMILEACLTSLPVQVIHAGKIALNMQCFFTAGSDEVKAWGIQVERDRDRQTDRQTETETETVTEREKRGEGGEGEEEFHVRCNLMMYGRFMILAWNW
eukprot:752950-Hanusia_phi.AAC.3